MTDARTIQQLERQLAECDSSALGDGTKKIDILNDLAWALSDTDLQRAYALSEMAYSLANSPDDGAPPYEAGMAYSLRTQGYINQRLGDYPHGMAQLLKAQGLFEALRIDEGLPDVFDGIAGIYAQSADFPEALDFIYKQLDAAQRLGDKRRIANAFNNLAVVYHEMGDDQRAIETLQRNLELAIELDYERIEFLSYANLTEILRETGDLEAALENARRGLRVSQGAGFELFEVHALELMGGCYLRLGNWPQAIDFLEQALASARRLDAKVTETLILLYIGEAYRVMQQPHRALHYALLGLTAAQAVDAKGELIRVHLLLSELYEQQGDLAQALSHFKQHNAVKEVVFGENADKRLKVLQVVHDTETAKKEAEIAHLRTVELQQEVTEHAQARLQLQRQLEFLRALSAFEQTLLAPAESEAESSGILAAALQHLLEPSQANTITLHQVFTDPEIGLYGQILVAAADTTHLSMETEGTSFSWSIIPAEVARQLAAGRWVSGPVAELYAVAPEFRDFPLDEHKLDSVLIFPIHAGGHWWGTVTMTEWGDEPTRADDDRTPPGADAERPIHQWNEDEILLLRTATKMIASTLQRWQAEANLRSLNEQLEQQVEGRTAELRDTVDLLRAEIGERERAERALQEMMVSLEHHLVARTEELAAFFDLTLLAGQGVNLPEVFEQVLPRIIEVTHSRAVCIHLFDADRTALRLAAQQNLAGDVQTHLRTVELPAAFQRWLQQPNDPLITTALSGMITLPSALRAPEFQTYLGAQIRIGQRTEGMLSCFRFSDRGFGVDEIALVTALAEQMGMMLETDRLRQDAKSMAVLEERQRLARDLHDSVTQSLYSLSLFSRAGREAAEDGDIDRLKHSLTELERNTLHALREMRLLLYELRPADLEQEGLIRAVELRLNTVERRVGLKLDVQLDEFPGISPNHEVELYHIILEALNNIVKHAAAGRLTLQLTHANGLIHLRIVDDGQGFDPSQTNGGLGLRNIRERVARLDGQLAIASEPGRGTRLEAVIPYRVEVN